jgi:hypothetical protein
MACSAAYSPERTAPSAQASRWHIRSPPSDPAGRLAQRLSVIGKHAGREVRDHAAERPLLLGSIRLTRGDIRQEIVGEVPHLDACGEVELVDGDECGRVSRRCEGDIAERALEASRFLQDER